MLKKIKEFFVGKPAPVVETAPYKVPEPAATTPIPLVVETAPALVTADIPALTTADIPAITKVVATPEKKARKPRAPKAEVAVKEKASAKAEAPKLTVVKSTKAKSKKA